MDFSKDPWPSSKVPLSGALSWLSSGSTSLLEARPKVGQWHVEGTVTTIKLTGAGIRTFG